MNHIVTDPLVLLFCCIERVVFIHEGVRPFCSGLPKLFPFFRREEGHVDIVLFAAAELSKGGSLRRYGCGGIVVAQKGIDQRGFSGLDGPNKGNLEFGMAAFF